VAVSACAGRPRGSCKLPLRKTKLTLKIYVYKNFRDSFQKGAVMLNAFTAHQVTHKTICAMKDADTPPSPKA
jgi:hypothetical protein